MSHLCSCLFVCSESTSTHPGDVSPTLTPWLSQITLFGSNLPSDLILVPITGSFPSANCEIKSALTIARRAPALFSLPAVRGTDILHLLFMFQANHISRNNAWCSRLRVLCVPIQRSARRAAATDVTLLSSDMDVTGFLLNLTLISICSAIILVVGIVSTPWLRRLGACCAPADGPPPHQRRNFTAPGRD